MNKEDPFTLLKFLRSEFWYILICGILLLVGFTTEAQEPRIVQITCGETQIVVNEPSIPVIFSLEWDKTNGWHYPRKYSEYPDAVTTPRYKVKLSNGYNMEVLTSIWWSKVSIAKGLLWHGDIPDWRNIGDGNPHPPEYIILDYKYTTDLQAYCSEQIRPPKKPLLAKEKQPHVSPNSRRNLCAW